MQKPSINIVGCGKLSKTIAKLLLAQQLIDLKGVVNSTYESAKKAICYLGSGDAYQHISELPSADIYLITTPDSLIKQTALHLQETKKNHASAIIAHCSGSLSSDELLIANTGTSHVASIHPIKSFAEPDEAIRTFSGTYCAIEGDKYACAVLKRLFEKIGAHVFSINKYDKKIYHAGSVIANNYLVTLHHHATQCYIQAGIEERTAISIASMLMTDSLNNLKQLTHQQALTGPIQRGDIAIIEQHLSAFNQANSTKLKDLYTTLGLNTVELTSHADDIKKALLIALKKQA